MSHYACDDGMWQNACTCTCCITRPRPQEPLAADALVTHGILEPKSYHMALSEVFLASVPCAHVLAQRALRSRARPCGLCLALLVLVSCSCRVLLWSCSHVVLTLSPKVLDTSSQGASCLGQLVLPLRVPHSLAGSKGPSQPRCL